MPVLSKHDRTIDALREENADLRVRLESSDEMLAAIRTGQVDAITVETPEGLRVFTLKGADQPYRVMVETMSEGAVTVTPDDVILYSNQRFADMLGAASTRSSVQACCRTSRTTMREGSRRRSSRARRKPRACRRRWWRPTEPAFR